MTSSLQPLAQPDEEPRQREERDAHADVEDVCHTSCLPKPSLAPGSRTPCKKADRGRKKNEKTSGVTEHLCSRRLRHTSSPSDNGHSGIASATYHPSA